MDKAKWIRIALKVLGAVISILMAEQVLPAEYKPLEAIVQVSQ